MASSASAVTLSITDVSLPSGTPFNLSISGGTLVSTINIPAPYAGQIVLSTGEAGTVGAWCVDLWHDIYLNDSYTYTTGLLTTNSDGSNATTSTPITTQQAQEILGLATYGNDTLTTIPLGTVHDMFSGEVQAAIWSIVNGGATVTASGGSVNGYTPQNFMDGTQALITMAPTLPVGPSAAIFNLDANGNFLSQNLVATSAYLVDVPEPSTLGLVSLAIGGTLLRRRRNA